MKGDNPKTYAVNGTWMDFDFMWLKQCHKPPMTGNGVHIPPKKMVILGMVYDIVSTTLSDLMNLLT